VPVDDFLETPTPFLLMPYYSFENLSVQHSVNRITWDETESVVFQSLLGLAYLHPQGVAHRDLKPENILVESRYPLSIKLADFGLANDKRDLTTFCGSQVYAAPEIYFRNRYSGYTTAVDLWSLGVIALQYLCGFPNAAPQKPGEKQKDWVLSRCRRLIAHASDHMRERPNGLLSLVATGMLREEAEERLPASTCLALGYDWGLFEEGIPRAGRPHRHSTRPNRAKLIVTMVLPQF
jgi:serine/threonine protein kinase